MTSMPMRPSMAIARQAAGGRARPCSACRNARYVHAANRGLRTACMKALWLAAPALLLIAPGTDTWAQGTSAQVQVINRMVNGQPDTDIRVGVFVNVKPD